MIQFWKFLDSVPEKRKNSSFLGHYHDSRIYVNGVDVDFTWSRTVNTVAFPKINYELLSGATTTATSSLLLKSLKNYRELIIKYFKWLQWKGKFYLQTSLLQYLYYWFRREFLKHYGAAHFKADYLANYKVTSPCKTFCRNFCVTNNNKILNIFFFNVLTNSFFNMALHTDALHFFKRG